MFNKKIKLAKFSYLHMVNISHEKMIFEAVRDLFPKVKPKIFIVTVKCMDEVFPIFRTPLHCGLC